MNAVSSIVRVSPAEAAKRLYHDCVPYYIGVVMATKAEHMLGDISRDKPAPAAFHTEEEDAYVGSFIEGFGFTGVRFPKAGCRSLTEAELVGLELCSIEILGLVSR